MFTCCEPRAGWWAATARERPAEGDCAHTVAALLESRYAACDRTTLVLDNLNRHAKGAFYTAFEASRAHGLVRRIEFRYTLKHSSWLNIAVNELNSMTQQCLSGRQIGDSGKLRGEFAAW